MNRPTIHATATQKPMRQAPVVDDAQQLIDLFKMSSRDHNATISNDALCREIADHWPAFDLILMQIQRDMARTPSTNEAAENLNAVHAAFAQIHTRILEFVDRGNQMNAQIRPNAEIARNL